MKKLKTEVGDDGGSSGVKGEEGEIFGGLDCYLEGVAVGEES